MYPYIPEACFLKALCCEGPRLDLIGLMGYKLKACDIYSLPHRARLINSDTGHTGFSSGSTTKTGKGFCLCLSPSPDGCKVAAWVRNVVAEFKQAFQLDHKHAR